MNKTVSLFLIIACCWSCSSKPTTEKHQSKRDNIINVRDRIKEIVIDDPFIYDNSRLQIIDKYLIIEDNRSIGDLIHIFDKDNFRYIKSIAPKGQGPGEITILGHIAEDKVNRKFYVSDHGKNKIFSYDLDSVITESTYLPVEKYTMVERLFPANYTYINDTLSIGVIIEPIGSNDFKPVVGKLNMRTGDIKPMNYTVNPNVKRKRFTFGISMEHGIYLECYGPHDLMTICDLEGELKYNIYGPNWDTELRDMSHYGYVTFCDNKIVASYSGDRIVTEDIRTIWPTKFIVFDLEGNYLKTLETGYQIMGISYDKDNHRIIMTMDDEIQFAYLELDGLLD